MASRANIHLYIGLDDWSTDTAAKKVIAAAVPDVAARATAVETIDATGAGNEESELASVRAASDSIFTPPFFDPVKVTWWRNVRFLPGGAGRAAAAAVKAAVEKFAAQLVANPPAANQVFILTAPSWLKTSVFAKTLAAVAEVVEFASGKKARDRFNAALQRLPELAADAGVAFAPGADSAFVAKAGTDTRTLVSELEKLRTYLGPDAKPATRADIDAIVSPALGEEAELWGIQDAIVEHDPAKMLETVRRFQGDSGWAIMTVQTLVNFARDMIVARDQSDRKLEVPGKSPWMQQRNAARCRALTLMQWRRLRYRLLKLRERLVSTQMDDAAIELQLMEITKK